MPDDGSLALPVTVSARADSSARARPPAPSQEPVVTLGEWQLAPGVLLDLCRYSGEAATFGRHHHETCDLSLLIRGAVEEQVGRRTSQGRMLHSCFKPAGLEHADRFRGEVEILRLRVDSGLVPLELRRSLGASWRSRPDVGRELLSLVRSVQEGGENLDFVGRVADLLSACETPAPATPDPVWMSLLEERIEDGLGEGLRVGDLARDLGLHPVYLARAVRSARGCSVRRLILKKRLERALGYLRGTSLPLADVAVRTGFSDQAHLTRHLSEDLGWTPAALRRLGR
ncbi:MAG: helix-turn-helix transcriptional regulator [Acidobacteria bacterium]|nr:helix-turn-helix transcriptional regulator [Acidobacteriota bacterium]